MMKVIKDITGSTSISIATSERNPDDSLSTRKPTTLLIHDLTANDVELLLSWVVWANKSLAFQVSPIPPSRPTFLFMIRGFTTESTTHVQEVIAQTWRGNTSSTYLKEVINQFPKGEERDQIEREILAFLNLTYICHLDYKNKGGIPNPFFNIYANRDLIKSADLWINIQNFLHMLPYQLDLLASANSGPTTQVYHAL
jgi:hypothetical protein